MKRQPKKQPAPPSMPIQRSCEIIGRTLDEHADAFLVAGIRPDGIPFVVGRAMNPAYCMALNAMLLNIVHAGGIQVGKPE